MYEIKACSKKAEKELKDILQLRASIAEKLERLKQEPRKALEAHKLKGKLEGFWSCYLGGDIRLMYEISDETKEIIVVRVGSHKIY